MKLRIQILQRSEAVRTRLQRDGWRLEVEDDCWSAQHPQVSNEPAARERLHSLGLLTSRTLRIEFPVVQDEAVDLVAR